jgi:sterol desaturase/sphingolipid hydroxylase (fatty acid hydroxylase superfamily)
MEPWAIVLGAASALLGRAYAAILEWVVHRYVFHGLGRRKGSRFAFHYVDHHRECRRQDGLDPAFAGRALAWNGYGREVVGLALLAVLHAPLLLVAPGFYLGALYGGWAYHRTHKRAHQDPAWCRDHLRHHWDHHMGDAQAAESNWGVSTAWVDRLLGTRVPWWSPEERAAADARVRGAN